MIFSIEGLLESIVSFTNSAGFWGVYGILAVLGIVLVIRHERRKKNLKKLDENDITNDDDLPDALDEL